MKCKVTISRDNHDTVRISIVDDASGIEFVEAHMDCATFGMCITGMSYQEAKLEVRGLEWVGKKRVTENRSIVCPLETYKTDELSAWLKENAKEDGWLVSTYLGTRGSVQRTEAGTLLRYTVTKYV